MKITHWSRHRIAVACLVTGMALIAVTPSVQAQERLSTAEQAQTVTLSASAFQEVPHDWLVMQLSITREGTDAGQVQAQIRTALDAALQAARARARPMTMEVKTGHFGLQPRYSSNGKINGWQGRAELVLEGRDFELIARTAANVPQLTVSHSQFTLSRQARQALESQVQQSAIEQFRERAGEIARGFGFSDYVLGRVSVGSVDGGPHPRPMMMAGAAKSFESADAAVPIEAGKETVQVTVSGSIHLR